MAPFDCNLDPHACMENAVAPFRFIVVVLAGGSAQLTFGFNDRYVSGQSGPYPALNIHSEIIQPPGKTLYLTLDVLDDLDTAFAVPSPLQQRSYPNSVSCCMFPIQDRCWLRGMHHAHCM
jgi:hypothetical protein